MKSLRKNISIVLLSVFAFLLVLLLSQIIIAADKPIYKDPEAAVEDRVEDLLSRMTMREKVGQMVQADRTTVLPEHVSVMNLGSVLNGGNSTPIPNRPDVWVKSYNDYQKAALSTRLGIPIIFGVDAVHGFNNISGSTIFPHNIGLGATRDPELIKRVAEITALEAASVGVDWDFAPCVAVARDIRWGRTFESFGENPELQRLLTASYIEGIQGPNNEMNGEHLVATAKHFIGDGGAKWGTGDSGYPIDQGDTIITEEELRRIHLPGYLESIDAGVGSIMVSHGSYQGLKMHANKYLVTDLLKGELGYDGMVVSDWESFQRIRAGSYYEQVVKTVNSGIDMFMAATSWTSFKMTLEKAVKNGDVSEERIDDAVRRILRLKFRMGLFEHPYKNEKLSYNKLLGAPAHREVAREAVRESLVLLKNDNKMLPIAKNSSIYIAGSNADDIGNQCGGWTISWEGSSGSITDGTTILQGIRNAIAGKGEIMDELENADLAVAVIGEKPYVEGIGDDGDLELSERDISLLKEIKASGTPVLVIMISGRPMMVKDYISDWDAFVEAWLPGTEGEGVADVIFGDYNFTGKLPVTWPADISQLPINYDDKDYSPLFEYGYGLSMDI